jgi:DNA-binding transcriptional LysR family regulator
VLRERFVCAVRSDHPQAEEAATLEGYLRLKHVRVAPRGRQGSLVDALLDSSGLSRQISVSVPSFLSAPYLVANTDLVATLPERLAVHLKRWLPLRLFEPPLPLPGFALSMLWDERTENDPSAAGCAS